jgi:hypothetical protein
VAFLCRRNEMVVKAGHNAESKRLAGLAEQRRNFKQQLDAQKNDAESRKRREKEAKEREAQQIATETHAYMKTMDEKKRQQLLHFEKLRAERDAEMQNIKNQQAQARQQKRDEENKEIARVKKMQQEDQDRIQQKRRENSEKMQRWKLENEENMREKERLRQKQQEDDMEFARKAKQALDDKEAKRLEELRILAEKMKAREKYGNMLGDQLADQAREDEARMFRIQEAARIKAEAQFQERVRREHQKMVELRATLDRQVQDLERRKKEEHAQVSKQSELFRQQAHEAELEAQRELQRGRERKAAYRAQLEDQLRLDVKLRPAREMMMSEVERKINRHFQA